MSTADELYHNFVLADADACRRVEEPAKDLGRFDLRRGSQKTVRYRRYGARKPTFLVFWLPLQPLASAAPAGAPTSHPLSKDFWNIPSLDRGAVAAGLLLIAGLGAMAGEASATIGTATGAVLARMLVGAILGPVGALVLMAAIYGLTRCLDARGAAAQVRLGATGLLGVPMILAHP